MSNNNNDNKPEPVCGWCDYKDISNGQTCKEKANIFITHNNRDIERKCDYHFELTRGRR